VHRQQCQGWGILLAAICVLLLMAIGVIHHRESLEGPGVGLFWTDVALLVGYGSAGAIIGMQWASRAITAITIGAQIGLLVGTVGIANHLIEAFVSNRPFVFIICPVLITFSLLGTAGAMAWERTGSMVLAIISGFYCAVVAALVTLAFASSFNLLFAERTDRQLLNAFVASGMLDPAAFRVRNILESSSEILVRMPVLGFCLALTGAAIQFWMNSGSRRTRVLATRFLAPVFFSVGVAALYYANAIERGSRPPFVLSGALLVGVSLCAVYPIWSAFHPITDRSEPFC